MSNVIDQVQHEFWQPPVQAMSETVANRELSGACGRCGTEFIVGARYCHNCGVVRAGLSTPALPKVPGLTELVAAGQRLGLEIAAFIAFLAGIFCVVGALAVGVIFGAKTFLDWQAIQVWRIEWLLGAIAAFLAGILLRKARS